MKLHCCLLFLCALSFSILCGQGNEWIHFDQQYFKIPVAADGIYRVTANRLFEAGFQSGADPRKLQLFHRGQEVAIIVHAGSDGIFNSGDYVEFFGKGNDGVSDVELYETPAFQPHQLYNLFSDTTAYFLTIGFADGARVILSDVDGSDATPLAYHIDKKVLLLTSSYSTGVDYGQVTKTTFDRGEGWMGPMILYNQPEAAHTVSGITQTFEGGGNPKIKINITGRGGSVHPVDIFVGPAHRLLQSVTINGYETTSFSYDVEWSDISGGGDLTVYVKVNGEGTRVSVGYVIVEYPQLTNAVSNEKYFFHFPASTSKRQVGLSSVPTGSRIFDVSDPLQVSELLQDEGNVILSPSTVEQTIFTSSQIINAAVERIAFRNIQPAEHDYVIISHNSLRAPTPGFNDPVEGYAAYRASTAGGEYDTMVVNVDQLYDQFNYGEKSPLAIFRFVRFLASHKVPAYIFIIGKGLDPAYNADRFPLENFRNLIPPAGSPGSDIAYTAGVAGSTFEAGIPIGRITAMTPEDVANYLNKVIETESRPFNDLRRKHVLHLSGGINPGEPPVFRAYLESFRPLVENSYYGGQVSALAKQSLDLKLINVSDEVNKGLNLITFFGHAAPGALDFDIGYVTSPLMGYDNKGKYPFLLMNGCDAGAFFLDAEIFGENWINAKDRGAVGFIAHASYGFPIELRAYSRTFYEVGFTDTLFIGESIGNIQKELGKRFLVKYGEEPIKITHVQQMMLLGDPAVALFGAKKPDYAVRDENLSIEMLNENSLAPASDSLKLSFIVRNFGIDGKQSFRVSVKRTLSDRTSVTYDSIYQAVKYSDTLEFLIRDKRANGYGSNTFAVRIDADNIIDELNESNNIAYIDYFLPSNGTLNLFPQNYGIVNTQNTTVSFQHTDIFSDERDFVLELDTVRTFDSDFKKSFNITAKVLARQSVNLLPTDSTVYYWRTKIANPLSHESKAWNQSSFTLILDGEDGWAQIDFDQLNENVLNGLVADPIIRNLKFEQTTLPFYVKTFGALSDSTIEKNSVKISGTEYLISDFGNGCRNNTINFIAFDRKSTNPYAAIPFLWYNKNGRSCGRNPWVINSFSIDQVYTNAGDDILQYVDNVAEGDSVLIFSIGDAGVQLWPDAVKQKLSQLGVSLQQLGGLSVGEPLVIIGRKGISEGNSILYTSNDDLPEEGKLEVAATVSGGFTGGTMQSRIIGPSIGWKKIDHKITHEEDNDAVQVDILGMSSSGEETILFSNVGNSIDISSIDADAFPYLKLVFQTVDDLNLTPAQLASWVVSYDVVSEGFLYFDGDPAQQTLVEGSTWTASYGFVNVSNKSFSNELTVNVKSINRTGFTAVQQSQTILPPGPGDTTRFLVEVNTFGKKGLNDVEVYVNPRIVPELYFDNNAFSLSSIMNVIGEPFEPVIEVTVDKRYIERGEYISNRPVIDVAVWDENTHLKIIDTTTVKLFISRPCAENDCPYSALYFKNPEITWKPATDTTHFMMTYTPALLDDGEYKLRVVASDRSGNEAAEPYEMSFTVKSAVSIRVSDPYPNPTASELHLDVVISGDVEKTAIELQLIDLQGVLIRTYNRNDFPALNIGNNKIVVEMDKPSVPPGLYVYRLITTDGLERRISIGKLFINK